MLTSCLTEPKPNRPLMKNRVDKSYSACRRLLEKHVSLPSEISHFNRLLNNFHDDKNFAANLRRVKKAVRRLQNKLERLTDFEERHLFPFLRIHIPRLEPLIVILLSEHEDFRRLFRDLTDSFDILGQNGEHPARAIQKIQNESLYLTCLLRSHFWAETKDVYQVIRRELKTHEKKLLLKRL